MSKSGKGDKQIKHNLLNELKLNNVDELKNTPVNTNKLQPQQYLIYTKLREKSDKLARIYISAIYVLNQEDNPDRFSLASHNFREIIDNLNEIVNKSDKRRANLKERVIGLKDQWIDFTNNGNEKQFLKKVSDFFEWFQLDFPKRKEDARKTLRNIDPSKRPLPDNLENLAINYIMDIKKYFAGLAHHGRKLIISDFFGYLSEFEKFLLDRIVPRTFDDFAEIDEIIREFDEKTY